jgi:release factor glutamine methyltransferase
MKVSSNKAIDIYKYYRDLLTDIYGVDEASSLMAMLFDHFISIKRHEILSGSARRISESELLKIHFACKELLKQRPIQYITGTAWFYGEAFKVTEAVLIPRPETEELCDWIIKDNNATNQAMSTLNILDIGTGSGCIAVTLKKNIGNAVVTALDVSAEALQVARENAATHSADIDFLEEDILKKEQWPAGPFDIIVSNPPYVRELEKELMKPNVLEHEPHLALFVENETPLIFYEAIARFALQTLSENGKLYFEINENLQNEMKFLLENLGFEPIEFKKDMHNKTRMVCCSLKNRNLKR